jgi:hypothetical protein
MKSERNSKKTKGTARKYLRKCQDLARIPTNLRKSAVCSQWDSQSREKSAIPFNGEAKESRKLLELVELLEWMRQAQLNLKSTHFDRGWYKYVF